MVVTEGGADGGMRHGFNKAEALQLREAPGSERPGGSSEGWAPGKGRPAGITDGSGRRRRPAACPTEEADG